jgi:signal transduction histidine kinase
LKKESLYACLQSSQFVEKLNQTPAGEYWVRAIAVIRQFLTQTSRNQPISGMILSHSPQILFDDFRLTNWVFVSHTASLLTNKPLANTQIIQLAQNDQLAREWFCLLITLEFSILVLSSSQHHACLFSLHPEPVGLAISALKQRVQNSPQAIAMLETQLKTLPIQMPAYSAIGKFATLLITQPINQELPIPEIQEVDIIKAITHEVKTPLTTIRTLVQSLLRRKDVVAQVRQRLEQIDFECHDQIERFNLIFAAVQPNTHITLELTHLEQILQIELWQAQAKRRQLTLKIISPPNLPAIASNTKLLNYLLSGLVDKLIRSLPIYSHIELEVSVAGDHLKLKFQSHLSHNQSDAPILEAVGQWLMLQPETGTLSLSMLITKSLFQSLGGKLTVRMYPTSASYDGEILTIFLPIYV